MGMIISFMGLGTGLPSTQLISFAMGKLYDKFIEKEKINDFNDFHIAILAIFNTFNSALPAKHYDVPSREEVKTCYEEWKDLDSDRKKKVFTEFMTKKVNLNKVDPSVMITGIVAPPVAMASKRAGESVPQLKVLKAVPDVIFVPSATVLALISVKISRSFFKRAVAS